MHSENARLAPLRSDKNLYPEQIVFERVDDNKDVAELCWENSTPVVSPVFSPHNVHLDITSYTESVSVI